MAKSDFIPARDAEFLLWHDNLKTQAQTLGATLGITTADLTGLSGDNTVLHEVMGALADIEARAAQATAEKNLARKAAEQRVRTLAKRLKLHAAYNVGFGDQLRIEGIEDTTNLAASKPRLAGRPSRTALSNWPLTSPNPMG